MLRSWQSTGSLWAARFFFCIGLLLRVAAVGADEARPAPEAASGFVPRPSVHAAHFMAVTANRYATDAAFEVLARGGNAVDAALTAQLVLNVVEPQSSGIGGGAFLLYFDAANRHLSAYDGRETAPAAATPQRFIGAGGNPLRFDQAVASGHAIGVPGVLAMLAMAHERHGRLPWPKLFEPAIRLAEEGFPVSPRLHQLLDEDRFLRDDASARALYYRADGSALPVGSRLANPALAAVLRRLAEKGAGEFYRGEIAHDIVAAVQGQRNGGGDMSLADLAAYRPIEREAVCGSYRGYRVCGMPPPSSGGVTVLELLGLLERTDFAQQRPLSAAAVHDFAEAGSLAYADRRRYLGDPGFVAVPQTQLLDPAYLDARSKLISPLHSLGMALPGYIAGFAGRGDDSAPELPATTHLSIVDAEGNAVAMTSSVEAAFGSRTMVRGFLLNNQLTDFSFRPDDDGRPAANRVEPGKRPLSSMAPTLVFDQQGRLYAALGSPGGSQIINYVAETLTALLDWHQSPDVALALPHFGSRNGPLELERDTGIASLAESLQKLGHRVEFLDMTSGDHLLVRDANGWVGAADPRREGTARGE
jgi:gamma-glutamyltranspeptidase/glutathione hydrolase